MNTTFQNSNHPKILLNQLKKSEGLPFHDVLPAEKITKYMGDGYIRDRVFSLEITLWGFLSQVLSDDKSCQAAVARVIAFFAAQGKVTPSANTAAYSKARTRLPESTISSLAKESAEQLEKQAPKQWLWRDRQIKLVDGSTLFMPDTTENQIAYPQCKNQKPGLGFPIARMVAIISYATGVILDVAISQCFGKGAGEHSLLRQLMRAFKPGDIALGDSYYASFFLIAAFVKLRVDVAFPMFTARNYDFRKGHRLGKKDHTVEWHKPQKPQWMSHDEYETFPSRILIREVAIDGNRKGFRTQPRIIVTTLIDARCVSKEDLKMLYDYRWCVELDLRAIKDTMRMGILRGKTPSMVRKEIWMHILAYNLIRKVIAQAAFIYNKKPRQFSFKVCLQAIMAFRCYGILIESKNEMYMALLKAITYKVVGNRPGRSEPRRLKRRPKNYSLLVRPRYHYHKGLA